MEIQRNSPIEVLVTVPFQEDEIQMLRELSPRLRITMLPAREPGDIPKETWARSEVLYTDKLLPTADQAPALRWVQFHWAGVDSLEAVPLLKKNDLMITTLSGAAAPQMAEFALTMILALGHRLPELNAQQLKSEWPRDRWERFRPQELRSSTVGILGYGSIGREIARLVRAFGATVLAAKRDVMHPADSGYTIPGLGDPGGDLFHRLYPYQAIRSMMGEVDFAVVVAPLTAETRGMVGAAELGAMKSTAFLINMARGGVVDQNALVSVLHERKIAGAALDVFHEEPLPSNSPFWKMSNVMITPHIGGMSVHYNQRAIDLFSENIKRYLTGAPLYNRYDPQRGY
ncbi:MAG: D-2-hydroxyacid dehydrogenase [Chloroflexi bacterium]|nr:MAG: D-2-hydroxyacid dehydrogenase [Chloroflexota bacterium]